MTDHGYTIASAIADRVRIDGPAGAYRMPDHSREAINHLEHRIWRDLTRPGPLWSNIRLVHDGRDLHPSRFMTARIGDGLIVHSFIDTDRVSEYLTDGATLIYNHLHESSDLVQRIQEVLEYQLHARVWVQAYLTRTAESAFGLHVDDHNFLVLQIAGKKAWDIKFATISNSQPEQPRSLTLTAGDFIAVPANTPHKVRGHGVLSLHLTIAFDWLDQDVAGSSIPIAELEAHRATARLGSTLPLTLAPDYSATRLPFKFRDRVRPSLAEAENGTVITCYSGSFMTDPRFDPITAELARGRELTTVEMGQITPQLDDNDLDKFLRFGIENRIFSCSG